MAPLAALAYLLSTLLFVQSTFATLETTPAPAPAVITAPATLPWSPSEEEREFRKYIEQQQQAELFKRQSNPGNRVCYGFSGEICSLALLVRCSFALIGDEWFKCYCESGKVAIQIACQNCVDTYDLGGSTFNQTSWKSDCDKKGFTIGPIPSSALSSWSAFNATFTGSTVPLPKSTKSASSTGGLSSTRKTGSVSGATFTGSTTKSRLPGEGEPGVTFTLYGDPTGSKVLPLTTTTGTPPLQNVPLAGGTSGAGSVGLDGDRLRVLSLGALGLALLVGFSAIIPRW